MILQLCVSNQNKTKIGITSASVRVIFPIWLRNNAHIKYGLPIWTENNKQKEEKKKENQNVAKKNQQISKKHQIQNYETQD